MKSALCTDAALTRAANAFFDFIVVEMPDLTPKERALGVAKGVGTRARKIGCTEPQASRWLQTAYGAVWVRRGNLNPGADLKDVKKVLLQRLRGGK